MDDRELTQRIKTLSKAIHGQEPPTVVVNMLEALKKDFSPTEEQLRTTKAGVIIGKLRSHVNRDIARGATEIVTKWRKNVDAAKEAKKQRSLTSTPTAGGTPRSTASPLPTSSSSSVQGGSGGGGAGSSSKPYDGDREKRHFKTDKVDISRTNHATRDNSIGVLYNGLAFRAPESIEDVLVRAMECEAAAWKAFKGDTPQYRSKMRGLFSALKRRDNRQLGRRVMSGEISVERFVIMTDKELASEEQRARDAALEKENMMKAQVPMAEKSISDQLKCGKCGQKKVSYSQAQTRSADEPMTTFCECTVCGNRWKFS